MKYTSCRKQDRVKYQAKIEKTNVAVTRVSRIKGRRKKEPITIIR